MKTTITIDEGLAKTLNLLKYRYGFSTIEQVIVYYLNKGDKKNGTEDIQLVGLEIEKSNSGSATKVHDKIKTQREQNGSSKELPESQILEDKD